MKGPLLNVGTRRLALGFRLVAKEMFQRGRHIHALCALDIGGDDPGCEEGVLSHVFKISPVITAPVNVHSGAEDEMHSERAEFLRHSFGILGGQLRIPCCGKQ